MRDDLGRIRKPRQKKIPRARFVNPYPSMSIPEALVRLGLEASRIPFSWRYFDGVSPTTTSLIPDFAPEFTLREYKTVILISTAHFGTLPGILERNGLAQAALEHDGWRVLHLWDVEINSRAIQEIFREKAPWILAGTFRGPERPNPYNPDLMSKFREHLRNLNFARTVVKMIPGGIRDSRNKRKRLRSDARRGIRLGSESPQPESQRGSREFIRRG